MFLTYKKAELSYDGLSSAQANRRNFLLSFPEHYHAEVHQYFNLQVYGFTRGKVCCKQAD